MKVDGATTGAVLGLNAFEVALIGGLSSGLGRVVGGAILDTARTWREVTEASTGFRG